MADDFKWPQSLVFRKGPIFKPIMQSVLQKPELGQYGDCLRACISSLLGIDATNCPHFCDLNVYPNEAATRLAVSEFLEPFFLSLITVPVIGADPHFAIDFAERLSYLPHARYMLTGFSDISKANHVVICKDGRIEHDPSPRQASVHHPAKNEDGSECYWIGFLIDRQVHYDEGKK